MAQTHVAWAGGVHWRKSPSLPWCFDAKWEKKRASVRGHVDRVAAAGSYKRRNAWSARAFRFHLLARKVIRVYLDI